MVSSNKTDKDHVQMPVNEESDKASTNKKVIPMPKELKDLGFKGIAKAEKPLTKEQEDMLREREADLEKQGINVRTKVNLKGLFEKGFQSEDWINATSLDLPARLKYKSFDEYEGKYGGTYRYYFEDSEGRDIRLLCKGKTFNDLIKKHVPIGSQIDLFKNDQNYWVFEPA